MRLFDEMMEEHCEFEKELEETKEDLLLAYKVIDEMARMLNSNDIDEDICRQMGKDMNCNEYTKEENCIKCIKEYFYKKVE